MHPMNFIITKTVGTFCISNNGTLFLLKSIGGFINGFWFDVNHVSSLYESGPELTSAGLKHSVTAKPDIISHQTPCNSIRFIIFSQSTSDFLPLSLFLSFLLSFPLFNCLYHCTVWRICALLLTNKSSCPEWCHSDKITTFFTLRPPSSPDQYCKNPQPFLFSKTFIF